MSRENTVTAPAAETKITCQETFDDRICGRPATHVVGFDIGYGEGYPACSRCAKFWTPECVRELTEMRAA